MKKVLRICFLVILFPLYITAQNIDTLDKKNGFKSIKLDSKFDMYINEVTLIDNDEKSNLSLYKYIPIDKDLYYIFNTEMDGILLSFSYDSKELQNIMFRKEYSPDDNNHYNSAVSELEKIIKNLTSLFGKPTGLINNKGLEDEIGVFWRSKNVELIVFVSYKGLNKGSDLHLTILKNSFAIDTINNGF